MLQIRMLLELTNTSGYILAVLVGKLFRIGRGPGKEEVGQSDHRTLDLTINLASLVPLEKSAHRGITTHLHFFRSYVGKLNPDIS